MNRFAAIPALLLLMFSSCALAQSEFVFSDFPVKDYYAEPLTAIDFSSHEDAEAIRDRLNSLVGVKANFAGQYHVMLTGCGTMCQAVVLIDMQSGSIVEIETASTGACFGVDSRLLILNPFISSDFDDDAPEWAYTYYYEITKKGLELLSKTKKSFNGECQFGQ